MAELNPDFSFEGPLGNLSFYKRRGSKKTQVRLKGGPTKEQIQTLDSFAAFRAHLSETAGVGPATRQLRVCLGPLLDLAEPDITGQFNRLHRSMMKAYQPEFGLRPVLYSKYPFLMEGMNLNRQCLFEALIRHPLQAGINREGLQATVSVPELIPNVNFKSPFKLPYYQLLFGLNLVSDIQYDHATKRYRYLDEGLAVVSIAATEWLPCTAKRPALQRILQMEPKHGYVIGEHAVLVCTAGIAFGMPQSDGHVQFQKYHGSGKILKLG